MTDTPDILILVSATEMEALKADLARAEGVIDLLESHARVQAKLLADIGRERDALRGDALRQLIDQEVTDCFHRFVRVARKAYDTESGMMSIWHDDITALEAIALALTSTRPPDIEALCRDYAQRWCAGDWSLWDDDEKAELRIEAHRWIKCWPAALSAERRCQKCGTPTEGEEAWVDSQIWCHPCADAASPTQQGPLVPWELKCLHPICTAPECDCPAVSSSDTLCRQIAAIYGELDAEDCAWIDREWIKWRGQGTITYALSSTSDSPLMHAAEKAARAVDGWSDSKRQYAERAIGISSPNAVTIAAMEDAGEITDTHPSVSSTERLVSLPPKACDACQNTGWCHAHNKCVVTGKHMRDPAALSQAERGQP